MPGKIDKVKGITIEYELAQQMVVFSHGFGVQRDGRGLFTDIAAQLPKGFGCVLFDYNDIQLDLVTLANFSEQKQRLRTVLKWVAAQPGISNISLVAHSIGCISAALAQPNNLQQVLFLAPPTSIGERTRNYFTGKAGAIREGNHWAVPRNDGTTSIVPESFFDEFEAVDAKETLTMYADIQTYELITAGDDEVLLDANYEDLSKHPNVNWRIINGANHNFEGASRQELVAVIQSILLRG